MIKRYHVDRLSVFNQSLMLSFYEPGTFGFHIEGLEDKYEKELFSNKKIKFIKEDVDFKSVPSSCVIAYFDEEMLLKAVVLKSSINNYFLFKMDPQKDNTLNIHQKYISNDLDALLDDYEKHCKRKGKSYYAGIGDSSLINDIDYFEYIFEQETKKKIDKGSSIYKLLFNSNNFFVVDFIEHIRNGHIKITNKKDIDKNALAFESMQKHKVNRKDCLLIDSETKDIKYFIFTYKPHFINHYYLLKNLGNDNFVFITESISFNRILSCSELKNIKYKNGSAFAAKEFAKMHYDNFYLEYVAFEEEEEFDEVVKNELPIVEKVISQKDILLNAVKEELAKCKNNEDVTISYHGKLRILERIGEMSEEEMNNLARVAYERGEHSMSYYEKDMDMFKFLQYYQNKKLGKTLRLFKGMLFFYSMEPPHELVTCFPYENNYNLFLENKRDKKLKR